MVEVALFLELSRMAPCVCLPFPSLLVSPLFGLNILLSAMLFDV